MNTGDLIITAESLISENGAPVSIVRSSAAFDPLTSTPSAATEASQRLSAVRLPANRSRTGRFDKAVTEKLQATSIAFFYVSVQGMAFLPRYGDIIADSAVVLGVNVLQPSGVPVLLEILAHDGMRQSLPIGLLGLHLQFPAHLVTDSGVPITINV